MAARPSPGGGLTIVAVRLAAVVVGATVDAWTALGFAATGDVVPFGNGAIECRAGDGPALRVSGFPDLPSDVDGVPLLDGAQVAALDHPNGCFELDHVVIATPSIERTSSAIESVLGLPQRRMRETATVRQAFHRFADRGCIVELVESTSVAAPAVWGVVVNTTDLDAFVGRLGPDLVGPARPAVQPGRRITTVRRSAALGLEVAVMSIE